MKSLNLSIIIPVYNEKSTIEKLINKVDSVELNKEIIIVDDGSTDGSTKIIEKIKAKSPIIKKFHSKNQGKGAAIRTGLKEASGKFTVIQDADLEYDPRDLEVLIQPALKGTTKVVYGTRFKYAQRGIYSSRVFYLGGQLVTWLSNTLYDLDITDEPTCYKLIETKLLKDLNLQCTGFEFCPEVTAKLALRKEKISELPISYYPRGVNEGKKINWKDGLAAIKTLLKYKFFIDKEEESDHLTTGLEVVSSAQNYNQWIYQQISPHLKGKVLEIGAGIGTFTELISKKADHVYVLEIDPNYYKQLQKRFRTDNKVTPLLLDVLNRRDREELKGKFDTAVLINVLEHIENDQDMINQVSKLLPSGGNLFIFVPAHQLLFSQWDRSVGHYRRYSRKQLIDLVTEAGFKIKKANYFNRIGAIGWAINKIISTKPGQKKLSWQTKIFDRFFVPLVKYVERVIAPPFGQSIVLIAKK